METHIYLELELNDAVSRINARIETSDQVLVVTQGSLGLSFFLDLKKVGELNINDSRLGILDSSMPNQQAVRVPLNLISRIRMLGDDHFEFLLADGEEIVEEISLTFS